MKRFAVFAGESYYPDGGWSDFEDTFDDQERASEAALKLVKGSRYTDRWSQVVDLRDGAILEDWSSGPKGEGVQHTKLVAER